MVRQFPLDLAGIGVADHNKGPEVALWVTDRVGDLRFAVLVQVVDGQILERDAKSILVDFAIVLLPGELVLAITVKANGVRMNLNAIRRHNGERPAALAAAHRPGTVVAPLLAANVVRERTYHFAGAGVESAAAIPAN